MYETGPLANIAAKWENSEEDCSLQESVLDRVVLGPEKLASIFGLLCVGYIAALLLLISENCLCRE